MRSPPIKYENLLVRIHGSGGNNLQVRRLNKLKGLGKVKPGRPRDLRKTQLRPPQSQLLGDGWPCPEMGSKQEPKRIANVQNTQETDTQTIKPMSTIFGCPFLFLKVSDGIMLIRVETQQTAQR